MRKRSQKEANRLQLGCIACFTSIFFFVGIGLLWGVAIRPVLQVQASKSWKEVDCTVNNLEIESHAGDDGNTYSAKVKYSYLIDNQPYTGDRFWFTYGSNSDRQSIQNAIGKFEPGGEYTCYVNPNDPRDSVLVRELGPGIWIGWLIGGLFTVVGGLFTGSLISAMTKTSSRKIRESNQHSENAIPKSTMLKNATSTSDMRSDAIQRDSAIVSEGVREYECVAVPYEPSIADEPIILSSKDSRVGMAIASWFFALIWNSITWAIAYFSVRDGNWLGIAFSSLFAIVGLAVFVGAIYATLQIFNPKPTLVCSQNRLYPGTEFEISWTHRGNTGRIQQLHITLEGIEEVTFKQGTSSRTERSLFHQQTILQTTESPEINEGFRVLTLPTDTMHSFKSSRNAILWILKVHGEIAWWPDMTDQFPITIYPPTLEAEPRL